MIVETIKPVTIGGRIFSSNELFVAMKERNYYLLMHKNFRNVHQISVERFKECFILHRIQFDGVKVRHYGDRAIRNANGSIINITKSL